MLDLIKELSSEDYSLINTWMKNHTYNYCGNEIYLQEWANNKCNLYEAFGRKFILRKHITIERPINAVKNDLMETCTGYHTPSSYINNFFYKNIAIEDYYTINKSILNIDSWAKNSNITGSYEIIIKDKTVKIPYGCKPIRMIGKLLEKLNAPQDIMNYYEEFRIAHSMCLNQKHLEGDLCLSIHPLDFMTMSENDSGWSSCMNWDDGEYHLGTVECMNSPNVVVAYLDNVAVPMNMFDTTWTNKMWRQLLCFTPEILLGNKQYPYNSEELQKEAMNWLCCLLESHSEKFRYSHEVYDINNQCTNTLPCGKIYFNLSFDIMYNDIYDTRAAFLNLDLLKNRTTYFYDFSGLAICAQCGGIIEGDDADPACICCPECLGRWRCSCCEEYQDEYATQYCIDDRYICESCFENETLTCDCCGESHFQDRIGQIEFITDEDGEDTEYLNICENCNSPEFLEEIYGPSNDKGQYKLINFSDGAFDYMSTYSSYYMRKKRERLRSINA